MVFKKIFTLLCSIVLLLTSYINLTEEIKLKVVSGTFEKLKIYNTKSSYEYYIKLYEFQNDFYVSKIISNAFDVKKFKKQVIDGTEIHIMIKEDINLKKSNAASIYSIKKGNQEFLNQKKSKEEKKSNGIIGLVLGLVLGLGGFFFLNEKKTTSSMNNK